MDCTFIIISYFFIVNFYFRPGKVNLQFIVKAFIQKCAGGRSFITTFLKQNYQKLFKNFVRVRKSVQNWSKRNLRRYSVWSDAGGDDKLQINFAWPYSY